MGAGGRHGQRGALAGWLALALLLLATAVWVLVRDEGPPLPPAAAPPPPALPASAVLGQAGGGPVALPSDGRTAPAAASAAAPVPSNDLADHAHRFPTDRPPGAGEVIAELRRRGITEGLAAFNPPGTKPVLVGLAVPPDFPLPPGYVRHHQTTDDGQDVEPVLRFHPDHRLFDAVGRPVPLPPDLIVPPEWAPAGLPLRRIVVPPPLPPASAARP